MLALALSLSDAAHAYTLTEVIDSNRLLSVEITKDQKLVCTFRGRKSTTKKIPTAIHLRIMKELSVSKPKAALCEGQRRFYEHRDQKGKITVVCDNETDSFLIAKLSDLCQLPEPQ